MQPWHLCISSVSRLTLFPGHELLRRALWKLVEILGRELALFCIVDDHVHAVVVCDEETLGLRVRALTRATRSLTAVEVNPTHVRRVDGRRHMQHLLDYILQQPEKHSLPVHPALWEGSCLPDLVGARVLPGLQVRIMDALPRATQADALEAAGLRREGLKPLGLDDIRTLGPARLLAAAASATAADPALRGKFHRESSARRAACRLAKEAGIPMSELAWQLGMTTRACRRMAAHPGVEGLGEVVARRLALEQRVAEVASR
jgi:REP element-mobilizing transposase RayT